MIVFVNYSQHGGMWPEQQHNKDWIRFISAPLSVSVLKKKRASVYAYVTSATKNMVDTEAVTQISPWKWWWAFCVTLEGSPPSFTAQQLSSSLCQSYLSLFFPFFHGTLRRMRGEYRCCLLADSSSWLRVVFITGYKQIFLITFIFSQLTVSWWRASPFFSKWVSLLGSMSWVIL